MRACSYQRTVLVSTGHATSRLVPAAGGSRFKLVTGSVPVSSLARRSEVDASTGRRRAVVGGLGRVAIVGGKEPGGCAGWREESQLERGEESQ
eukprot:1344140-Rhodomonas_salina.1